MDVKCLDTYALVEIFLGNPKFSVYLNKEFVLTDLTLAEFYAVLIRKKDEKEANYWYKKLEGYAERVSMDVLIEAVKFRHKHKKQKISFFDAVGYIFSLKNGFKFVTEDKEFEKLESVEFRKK